MMKKSYELLELQIICLDNNGILTTSTEAGKFGADGTDDYGYDFWD